MKSASKLSVLVSRVILEAEGVFTINEIYQKVKPNLDESHSEEEMKGYIKRKLDTMADLGLVGKTNAYYFSV